MAGSRFVAPAALVVTVVACRPATQVTVDIATDVVCASLDGTAITVGPKGAVETARPATIAHSCSSSEHDASIGSIVLVPSGDSDDFGLKVVAGFGSTAAESCAPPRYEDCIVARRSMSFIAHTELYLPVMLRADCLNVPCDEQSTCVHGDCKSSQVPDPGQCTKPGACDEGVLPPIAGSGGSGGSGAAGGAGGSGAAGGLGGMGGAGGSGGSGGAGGGAPGPPCGGPSVLHDDFQDGIQGSEWNHTVVAPGTSLGEIGGHLVVAPAAQAQGNRYAGYLSSHAVNLHDDVLRVGVPVMVDTATHAQAFFGVYLDDQNQLGFVQDSGALVLAVVTLGQGDSQVISYDATAHRFWQLRESAGLLSWEVSSDGVAWQTVRTSPTPAFAAAARIWLGAGTYQSEVAPGVVHFDDLNTDNPQTKWCPSSSFLDDFEDGVQALAWSDSTQQPGCTKSEAGGAANFTLMTAAECTYQTATAFDLTQGEVVVHLGPIDPAMATGTLAALRLENDALDRLVVEMDKGVSISAYAESGGANVFSAGPVAAVPYMRIRETNGNLFFESSLDGIAYSEIGSTADPFPMTAFHAVLAGSSAIPLGPALTVSFLGYNTP